MRIIGLDVGTVRIGVARADTKTKIAIPDGFINVNGQEIPEIIRIINLHNTSVLVIGMPRSNNGSQTAQSELVRNFAYKIAATIPNIKIYFQDETLTSVEAEARLKARKRNYQKGEIDAEAAAIILQDFIERYIISIKQGQPMPKVEPINNQLKENQLEESTMPKSIKKKSNLPIIIIVCSILILFFGGGFASFYWYQSQLQSPKVASCQYKTAIESASAKTEDQNPDCKYQKFEVKSNETIDQISQKLKKQGLIRSEFAFKLFLKISQKATLLKTGHYDLRSTMSVQDITSQLEMGVASSDVFNFTVLPGETISQIKSKLLKSGYTEDQLSEAFTKTYDNPVLKGLYDINNRLANPAQPIHVSLEGYLYGETYQFYNGESPEHILNSMINQLENIVKTYNLEEKFKKRGLTLREGIILASIVQQESHSEDMPGVSMVFQNRLKRGMNLGSDVTAKYAADLVAPDRDKNDPNNNLNVINTDSLYNTRKKTGLPPGPICSPSVTALLAVAEPDENKRFMYYFLTGDDGKMYYSTTEAEHNQKIRDYCQKLCSVQL